MLHETRCVTRLQVSDAACGSLAHPVLKASTIRFLMGRPSTTASCAASKDTSSRKTKSLAAPSASADQRKVRPELVLWWSIGLEDPKAEFDRFLNALGGLAAAGTAEADGKRNQTTGEMT